MKRTKKLLPLMIKRIAASLSALLMIPALAACKDAGGVTGTFDWDENVLVYASLNGAAACREAVDKFNSAHTDVQIEVRDYSDEEGYQRLLAEIAAGRMPDILEMTGLPYQQLAEKGYLEDLWPYIEDDQELGRKNVLEPPLKAAEVNGGLYIAFDSVAIETLVGAESVVGDRISWSLKELHEAFDSMPEDATILEYYVNKATMFSLVFRGSLSRYVDWEAGQCSFDSEEFQASLEFINSYPSEVEHPSYEDAVKEAYWRLSSGRQMLSVTEVFEPGIIIQSELKFGVPVAFVGYPTENGGVGSYFTVKDVPLAISSTCQDKAAAWDFVGQKFKMTTAKLPAEKYMFAMPVNRNYFNQINRAALDKEPLAMTPDYSLVEVRPLSEEDMERYEGFIRSVTRFDMTDQSVYNIVWDACGPYFAGDKSLDETVELIQNRVRLYINEQR